MYVIGHRLLATSHDRRMEPRSDGNGRRSRPAADHEQVYGSTTWETKTIKIRTPAAGQQAARRRRSSWSSLPPWNRRKRLTLSIRYRGGAACWYEVESRGGSARFMGVTALHDVMREVMGL